MVTIFNRKEVYHGFSMEKCFEVRAILSANQIECYTRTVNLIGSYSRAHFGTAGMNMDYAYEYSVYVHKRNYGRAVYLLNHK